MQARAVSRHCLGLITYRTTLNVVVRCRWAHKAGLIMLAARKPGHSRRPLVHLRGWPPCRAKELGAKAFWALSTAKLQATWDQNASTLQMSQFRSATVQVLICPTLAPSTFVYMHCLKVSTYLFSCFRCVLGPACPTLAIICKQIGSRTLAFCTSRRSAGTQTSSAQKP